MKKFIQEVLFDKNGKIHWTKTTKEWFIKNGYESYYNDIIDKTSFLEYPSFIQRIYHIVNDITHPIVCRNCNINTPVFDTINKGYRTYCSNSCQAEYTKEDRKNTIIERYGELPFLSASATEKRYQTCIERYGCKFPLQNKEIQDKKNKTVLDVYGVENVSKLQHIKDKKVKSCLEHWGTENPNQSEEIQNKKKSNNIERYGVEYFFQTQEFKDSISDYKFPTRSSAEVEIFDFLKSILNCEIEQGNRSVLGGKELDLYIKDKNLAIEYCGLYWHSNKFRNNIYHKEKYNICKKQNIKLITIFEDEWVENKELIKIKLEHILKINKQKRIFARNCVLNIINTKEKTEFYNKYHIQKDGNSSINIGIFHKNELVACMSFKQRKKGIFELDRYATKYIIVGAFSKALNYFKTNFKWNEIITFSDLRWHDGDVYKQNGFKLDKEISPDYCYIINNKRIHKFNFRKNLIKKKFSDLYDETLSESENMKNIGILKVYDCGKLRFKLIKES